ncbi:MAG: hypothetical protein PHE54_02700 [Bacilli bacterium]|nr:hypothetical protein [Bacilli bacterium]
MQEDKIKYNARDVVDNNFRIQNFSKGEQLLINEFTSSDGTSDYIVIGMINKETINIKQKPGETVAIKQQNWFIGLKMLLKKYKTNITLDKNILDNLLKKMSEKIAVAENDYTANKADAKQNKRFTQLFNDHVKTIDEHMAQLKRRNTTYLSLNLQQNSFYRDVLFTKEGYDLITGRFSYSNGMLDRTIIISESQKYGNNRYESLCDNGDNCFFNYDDLEQKRPLTKEEHDNMNEKALYNFYNFNFHQFEKIYFDYLERTRNSSNRFNDDRYTKYKNSSEDEKLKILVEFMEREYFVSNRSTTR